MDEYLAWYYFCMARIPRPLAFEYNQRRNQTIKPIKDVQSKIIVHVIPSRHEQVKKILLNIKMGFGLDTVNDLLLHPEGYHMKEDGEIEKMIKQSTVTLTRGQALRQIEDVWAYDLS